MIRLGGRESIGKQGTRVLVSVELISFSHLQLDIFDEKKGPQRLFTPFVFCSNSAQELGLANVGIQGRGGIMFSS